MEINENNIAAVSGLGLLPGQRVVIVNDKAYALGVGGAFVPGSVLNSAIIYTETDKVRFGTGEYFYVTSPVTQITASIDDACRNTLCVFTTGDTIDYSFDVAAGFKINRQFDFQPNSTYVIAVDKKIILWQLLEDFEG